jgi:hypothetical protein
MRLGYVLVFLLGFISCAFLFYGFNYSGVEVPFGTGLVSFDANSPNDWIFEDDIIVFDDMVVLRVENATLSNYLDTGSMKPVLDEGANGIRVVPKSAYEIDVGDIVSYRLGGMLVVHRVVEKGFDDEGIYFIIKGDNNLANDGKIRFSDIEYVTIGVIW